MPRKCTPGHSAGAQLQGTWHTQSPNSTTMIDDVRNYFTHHCSTCHRNPKDLLVFGVGAFRSARCSVFVINVMGFCTRFLGSSIHDSQQSSAPTGDMTFEKWGAKSIAGGETILIRKTINNLVHRFLALIHLDGSKRAVTNRRHTEMSRNVQ